MKQQLEEIKSRAAAALANAKLPQEIDELRVRFLGKKGELTGILKQMGKLSPEERPVIGQLANEVRSWIETDIETRLTEIKASQMAARLESEKLDVTLPGKRPQFGAKHPLSIVLDEIKEIFIGMGFEIADGPEVETDYYNFEALNIPKDHPGPGYPGYLLYQREYPAQNPDLSGAGACDGAEKASDPDHFSRPGLPL